MSGSDAILVGEGWISEHYFTTDATSQSFQARVLERRKTWDAEAKEKRPTPRSRFTDARQALEIDLAGLAELTDPASDVGILAKAAAEIYTTLLGVLELGEHGLHVETSGPLLRVSAPGITERAPLAVVLALPASAVEDVLAKDTASLLEPLALADGEPEFTSAARLVSALFVDEDAAPDLVLILAGRWAVLAEQARWAEGRYLAIDLQLVCERNDAKRGGEIDRALTCLSAASIAPDADGNVWWHGVLEESVKHTVGVSKDLRDGVRLSIEIIANEVVTRRREKGLDPVAAADANELAKQALRFLYRILFLLYAEASPELGVLPVGAQEYDAGYSLDRLRELVQVELATPRARSGTHLYDSLGVLFRLVDSGHAPTHPADDDSVFADGLEFNALRADLFHPRATRFIDDGGLGNVALQQVLAHLLLSKEKRGRDRGFISYAELGINQLGAVYEGLMSYTGFFADTDLYEVAKGGDGSKGSWVVPVERADGIAATDFIKAPDPVTGEPKPVVHPRGSFVFRLAGRERQQSASYYTPEVLTRFTVGQALEELLDQDGATTSAAEILELTVCEPALGSGAFAIEAVRQLAEQYLKRRQDELNIRIDPDEYPRRLQEVKAYLALHNVYGVDLNATAVELAEISLWLDTMVSGLSAPWFGLHLRRGNSLIGARRAVYRRSQVSDKSWLKAVPRDVPLTSLVEDIDAERVADDGIHHFLLPADGWGAAADAAEAKTLAPDAVKKLKAWRGSTKTKPTRPQVDALVELANRVETLWQIAYRRLALAEQEARRSIPVWEARALPDGGAIQREQIEKSLADPAGAYQRLRRVMDAWTALWFWPLTEATTTVGGEQVAPPTVDQWIAGLRALLGRNPDLRRRRDQFALSTVADWEQLGTAEELDLTFAGARPVDAVLKEHPWLAVCQRVAEQQGFFHWNLGFATVFARGGFDLQVGNPPWAEPGLDVSALLAEGDPWWDLRAKSSAAEEDTHRQVALAVPGICELLTSTGASTEGILQFLGSPVRYPELQRMRPDLYRCFIALAWRHASPEGRVGLVHLDTHFTHATGAAFRRDVYRRLRRHWHFVNELRLFEIQNQKRFSVNVYGESQEPNFLNAVMMYHPDTAERSLLHDGLGQLPAIKNPEGGWDLRPHRERVESVDLETLSTWAEFAEAGGSARSAPMPYFVVPSILATLMSFVRRPRLSSGPVLAISGISDGSWKALGAVDVEWGAVEDWNQVVLQGSHLHILNPFFKTPRESMKNPDDWSLVDLETLDENSVPVTTMKIRNPEVRLAASSTESGELAISNFRLAWRKMVDLSTRRTFFPAVIPPGPLQSENVNSLMHKEGELRYLLHVAGTAGSLLADATVRSWGKKNLHPSVTLGLPWLEYGDLARFIELRVLRLNCMTSAFAPLWDSRFGDDFLVDSTSHLLPTEDVPSSRLSRRWSDRVPLRTAAGRRQALLEIDVIASITAGISIGSLIGVYQSEFPVLIAADRRLMYDANGSELPASVAAVVRRKGASASANDLTVELESGDLRSFVPPFTTLDREKDMRQAYAHFEQLLAERS